MDEIRFLQLKLMLDRLHLILTEPLGKDGLGLLVRDIMTGKIRVRESVRRKIFKEYEKKSLLRIAKRKPPHLWKRKKRKKRSDRGKKRGPQKNPRRLKNTAHCQSTTDTNSGDE
jgi:hypothetical protein